MEFGSNVPVDVDEILKGKLWLGNVGTSQTLPWLQENKITAIINISEFPSLFPEFFEYVSILICYPKLILFHRVRYKEVRIQDWEHEDIDAHFDSCIRFIDQHLSVPPMNIFCTDINSLLSMRPFAEYFLVGW